MYSKEEVKVAAVQISVECGKADTNIRKILKRIDEAADNNAKLIVLPECSHNGYVFENLDHAYELATPIPGPITNQICEKAKHRSVYVAIGLAEKAKYPIVYNSAILIDANGLIIGKYRKNFLHSVDKLWFQKGNLGYPVFKTPLGNIGMLICADGRIPEIARCEALNGAEVLLDLTNWGSRDQYLYNAPVRGIENGVWLIAADKVGKESPFTYPGHSFIMDPRGRILAEASEDKEEVIYAVIKPSEAKNKEIGPKNDIFCDRRTDLYKLFCYPEAELPIKKILQTPIVPSEMSIQVSAIQTAPILGNPKENFVKVLPRLEFAGRLLSKLIVLPELFLTGHKLTPHQAVKLAEEIPGSTTQRLKEITQLYNCYIVATIIEKDSGELYITAVLVGPEGIVGKYRKTHLWGSDKLWCTPGDVEYPVFEVEFGNIGIMIDYDGFFPEVPRILTLKGADIIAWPCNWSKQIYPRYVCPVRALENRVYIVAANRVGAENGERFIGRSMIVDPLGRELAIANSTEEDYIQCRTVDLALARNKNIGPGVNVCIHGLSNFNQILTSIKCGLNTSNA